MTNKIIAKGDTVYIKISPDIHEISMEQQVFFLRLTEGIFGYSEQIRNERLRILASDCNIQYLLPYLSTFIKDGIHANIAYPDLTLLIYCVRMVKSLLGNPHINLVPVLHEIIPAILSCALARKISKYYYDNHWTLRDFSVFLTATICEKYNNPVNNITNRVIGIYLKPLKNCAKYHLTSMYGAIKGLGSLGDEVIKTFLLPHLSNIGKILFLLFEQSASTITLKENNQVLLEAKHLRSVVLNVVAPVLLKTNNVNDGGLTYLQQFGYIGRFLYLEVKNLEKSDFKNPNPQIHEVVT
ncbi:transcription initiation factor TFIID subunit 6-like [Diabrotica undecimpunctata]|uniref:transcription initiation factor TFIID subunit 6-like n=1 Tax=Diabrotica undecimpunctata TaxID=50387 RepID=UPI003B641964